MDAKPKDVSRPQKLRKSSRLKKKSDFRFAKFRRLKSKHFLVVLGNNGKGRLGISLSKRILKSAVARNRVRRLLREVFRKNLESFDGFDVNVLGQLELSKNWKTLSYSEVEQEILRTIELSRGVGNEKSF